MVCFLLVGDFLCSAKAYKLNYVWIVYFGFYFLCFRDMSKKYCYNLCQRVFCLYYLLGALWFLTFRASIHFELIFVYGVRECSNLILSQVAVQFSQHYLLKRLSFLHCVFLLPLCRWVEHKWVGLFCSVDLCVCFVPVTYCLDYSIFVI